ncbi:hypothetical protein SFMTTN_0555 [Sulfuriferula multivorans]|uniref:Peptidase C39-like domain-containing protein n=1 Tax=Sulfuriferula multivorans TaxID=1559896 RepID=A0A401JB12_9PROT|nr:papain-like cysteine protease family protein [Sulfuriferula multivorans]GBL44754.1 hypothetical protein SFMTTN_0555 [Sulfuriferula multivorans]
MNIAEYVAVSSRPYSALLQEIRLFGRWFASRQLAFTMQAQTQTNWCWAANATSVSHFYWWFRNSWTQCRVANAELAHNDCCNSSVPAACNVPWYLDCALTRTNNFVSMSATQAGFAQVRAEIDAGRPVGARIGWSGGGGHFVMIYGYSLVIGLEYFDIDDPIYGKSHLTVADFSSNYQGSGSWTHTYFTKSFFKMPIKYLIADEAILQRIREARPLLSLKQDRAAASEQHILDQQAHAALGMAQRVYSIGLDALLSEPAPPQQSVGLRVYEMRGDTAQAFFDVSEDTQPRVLQMSASKFHLEPFTRGLAVALKAAEQHGEDSELRLLRVPALNFEALWIHSADDTQDLLVPLHAVGKLTVNQPVPLDQAFDALREAARPLAQMDDSMGA